MNITATNKKLRDLLKGIRDCTLIPRPEFQRRLVWTDRDKRKFLDTVLNGFPFPEIYIAAGDVDLATGEGTELLVDGQQRLTTLYQYFNGSRDLKLGQEIVPYGSLSNEQKQSFLEYDVVVRYIGPMSMDEIRNVFERINATAYALNAMEIHNARYAGEFKQFGEFVAGNPFFERHRIFSANELRRMDDVRFVLTLVITIMSTYFNRDEELETFLGNYNDEFAEHEEINREIDRVLAFVERCGFDPESRIWKRSNLFTVLVELHRALSKDRMGLDSTLVAVRLDRFFTEVEERERSQELSVPISDLEDYYKAALQATNDRGSRIRRGDIISRVIRGEYPSLEENLNSLRSSPVE